jgi:two-component system sensor histidine kinase CpxA
MNLFWKILLSFGLTITLILGGAVFVSTRLAETSFEQGNIQGKELVQQARQALDDGGREGLVDWLENNDRPSSLLVMYVLDENAEELLGRTVDQEFREDALASEETFRRFERRQEEARIRESRSEGGSGGDGNSDRSQLWFRFNGYPYRLFGANGERFYYQIRAQRELFGIFNWPSAQIALLVIAAAGAALMALATARYISRPIVRLQKASRALAAGALETRVGGASTKRSDEVGILARDFDAMAERIQGLVVSKETLLRDISHELRSPLARIRVALALAERHMSELGRKDVERIEQETERLDALVGQIMTLTRLRTQPDVRHEPVDLGECIDGIADNAHYEYPDVELEWSRQEVPAVLGDETELRSAIENVVRNALSFSGEGGRVSVALAAGTDAVSITVADSGPGVLDAELEQIFEPFYRTDQSRNHERRGEGIGLAITASVIQRHGGRVVARNRSPHGLEISMWIPYRGPARPAGGS